MRTPRYPIPPELLPGGKNPCTDWSPECAHPQAFYTCHVSRRLRQHRHAELARPVSLVTCHIAAGDMNALSLWAEDVKSGTKNYKNSCDTRIGKSLTFQTPIPRK